MAPLELEAVEKRVAKERAKARQEALDLAARVSPPPPPQKFVAGPVSKRKARSVTLDLAALRAGVATPMAIAKRGIRTFEKAGDVTGEVIGGLGKFIDPTSPPGMIGWWSGKGTKNDPRHFHGIPDRVAGWGLLGLLSWWALQAIEIDISNWWNNSAFGPANIQNTISSPGMLAFLPGLGFTVLALDSTGTKATAVSPRKSLPFLDWVVQTAIPTATTIAVGQGSLDSLSGVYQTAPGGTTPLPVVQGPPPGTPGGNSPGPGTISYYASPPYSSDSCVPGYTLMVGVTAPTTSQPNGTIYYMCVLNSSVAAYQAAGLVVFGSGASPSPGSTSTGPSHTGPSPPPPR